MNPVSGGVRRIALFVGLALAALLYPQETRTHPHVLVVAATDVVFNDAGEITEMRHRWVFDLPFSIYAVEGLDVNGDKVYSREELAPLAEVNATSLEEYDYFTFLYSGDEEPPYGKPKDYWLERAVDGTLTLHYTLTLEAPYKPHGLPVEIGIYDPEYFVAFSLDEKEPARLINAPADCKLTVRRPPPLDAAAAAKLAELPASMRELPAEYTGLVTDIENRLTITCGDVVAAAEPQARAIEPSGTPFGVAPIEPGFKPGSGGPFAKFLSWVSAQQSRFYRLISDAVTATKESPLAAFSVLAFAFIYGVLHAAGPGHGKAVISSYVLANGETARRGAIIAFLAAMLQAVSAIAIVGVMTLVLRMTSASMTRTAGLLEIASYVLIVAIGVSLVWRAVRGRGASRAHAHAHAHSHDDGQEHLPDGSCCGHAHAPDPASLKQPLSLASAWSAILAVGIRPCSGALILLVFCFAQEMYLLGVAGTFAMAVGTGGITAAIASSALGARALVARLARSPASTATLSFVIELGAGAFVLLFGLVFLAGALGRQGMI